MIFFVSLTEKVTERLQKSVKTHIPSADGIARALTWKEKKKC